MLGETVKKLVFETTMQSIREKKEKQQTKKLDCPYDSLFVLLLFVFFSFYLLTVFRHYFSYINRDLLTWLSYLAGLAGWPGWRT